jgi:hypothetical protein
MTSAIKAKAALIPHEMIERSILLVRGHRVMLDEDLAELYDVETRVLNQAVQRNIKRFPPDFMFRLTAEEQAECQALRSHFVILKAGRGQHRKYPPYAFTEQGVAMLSGILKSERAIEVNIQIMRAFVALRQMISTNKELSHRLDDLEKKYDSQFKLVFEAIRQLMAPPDPPKKRKIGFGMEGE